MIGHRILTAAIAAFLAATVAAPCDINIPPGSGWVVGQDDVTAPDTDNGGVPAVPVDGVDAVGVEGPAPGGAVQAMLAVDPKYLDGIVVVTARDGKPQPSQWTILARDSDDLGTLHKITVADGQVISDALSLNAYESERQNVAINPTQVQVDSGPAFQIAERYAAANNKIVGHVDYALTVRGEDAAPIWTLNCFSVGGGYLGQVVLLATTGDVLSHGGFKASPAP